MIRDLHHQGLNISQISRETGYIQCENTLLPKPCQYRLPEGHGRAKLDPYNEYIQNRLSEYPLSGARVHLRLHNSRNTSERSVLLEEHRHYFGTRPNPGSTPGGLGRMRSHRSGWQDTDHARSASPGPSPAARSPTYTSPKNSSCQISSFPSSIRNSSGM